ncbi:response regulator transcription factor [Mesonia mobilis]|uniref:response regulator transcription factor n=1 Tax=Mesonia mobilis TaxID=369791 RepID=UPI0024BB36E3|nr:response regulator transcription factor [Mesonia mobilis]|tara:strand:+ start:178 stop:855 length:678 start_codon:yes stop_codon:yes gene_type:complete
MKVLIIEDEEEMLQNMKQTLEKECYLVETATDYDSAFLKIGVYEYDCILLDISLPGQNGLEILKELKKRGISDGVIIVSAKNSLDDKLEGLHLGADDYLPKPFHMAELNARIKAIFRRRNLKGNTFIQIENLKIDIENRIAFIEGEELLLNRKEFDILFYLTSNRNRLVNKTALAEHVWGDHIDQTDSFDFIYSQIKNLRKKLKDHQAQVEVKAIYGIGYKLLSL